MDLLFFSLENWFFDFINLDACMDGQASMTKLTSSIDGPHVHTFTWYQQWTNLYRKESHYYYYCQRRYKRKYIRALYL